MHARFKHASGQIFKIQVMLLNCEVSVLDCDKVLFSDWSFYLKSQLFICGLRRGEQLKAILEAKGG